MSRFFKDFPEAMNEIRRDLNELGQDVHTETMQDRVIKDDPDFATKELANYMYTVTDPDFDEIAGIHNEWVDQEWKDRITGELNPGNAWKTRRDLWAGFLEGKTVTSKGPKGFSYTYSQRMGGNHIRKIIQELKIHPTSRQLYLPVWYPIDEKRRGERRVPCSLGYWFVYRMGKLHLTYMMRSCDFVTHYPNDVCLAAMLQYHIAERAGLEVGFFTHFIGSFHVYQKDVADAF